MRIAVNARFLLPGKLEGLGWYSHELLRRLVADHPEDEFIFFFDRPFDPDFVYAENVQAVVLFPPARHPVLWYIWFEWAVARALKKYQADVFFSPDSYLSLRSKVPTVMTVHDLIPLQYPRQVPWWSRDYYRYFIPRFLRRADHLVSVSEYTKKNVLNIPGVSPEKVSVVYNGCRENFQPLPEADQKAIRMRFAEGENFFFYSGAIHPRKNIPRLIRAFDQFKRRTSAPVRLLLAGRFAWETGPVKDAFDASAYSADIRFLGYVSDSELAGLTASALALVNVSLIEGFGLPVLEAMYCDTPVLCSNTSSLPEVAGKAALLVDPQSESEISEGLEKIYKEPAFREQLIELGKEQRLKFDWAIAAKEVYALLAEAAGN